VLLMSMLPTVMRLDMRKTGRCSATCIYVVLAFHYETTHHVHYLLTVCDTASLQQSLCFRKQRSLGASSLGGKFASASQSPATLDSIGQSGDTRRSATFRDMYSSFTQASRLSPTFIVETFTTSPNSRLFPPWYENTVTATRRRHRHYRNNGSAYRK
jgi:hypothetical protein